MVLLLSVAQQFLDLCDFGLTRLKNIQHFLIYIAFNLLEVNYAISNWQHGGRLSGAASKGSCACSAAHKDDIQSDIQKSLK
jgi:hypothetical protein